MTPRRAAAIAGALWLAAAAVELAMGRPPICTCGYVALWHGAIDAGNSQHLADWYSASHVVHGLIFYGIGRLALRRWRVAARFVAAVAIEAGWELVENTPLVIDRYRHATMALGYTGDSVVNSMSDIAFMAAGFLLASRLSAWAAVLLGMALELIALAAIRDDLTLNVLMLLWPIDAVRRWQAGG